MKRTYFLLLVLLPLFWCSPARAMLYCEVCRQTISSADSYITYEGKTFCSQKCFARSMPKCATCGKSIADGKGLAGGYVSTKDKYYCSDDCFKNSLPLCAVCGKRSQGGLRDQQDKSKFYCSQECYRTTLPKCVLCGAVMPSWIEIKGVKFCGQCAKLPECFNCQMPGAGRESKDGRRWCDSCMVLAVMDPGAAQKMFDQVRRDIKEHLNLSTPDTIAFYLVDADSLGRMLGHKNFAERGLYKYNVQYTVNRKKQKKVTREIFDIFILSGLSPANFRDVAAHELAHDINYRYFSKVNDQREVEGFAEYISALMNKYWGQEKVNESKIKNEQKEYAEAYKYFLKLGEKGGMNAVWEHMERKNKAGK
ncbi:MAG: LIM domain-containing protein [Desulfocucumaceae bacterium]